MIKIESAVTVLTCKQGKMATKKFVKKENGSIKKENFKAGKYFRHEEVPVHDLKSLGEALNSLAKEPRKLVIKGQIKKDMPTVVVRKVNGSDATFDAVARPYIMLDIDKFACPEFMNPAKNPEESVKWVLDTLPEPFRNTSCYYKFSSSQNVLSGSKQGANISIHLWFWCDRSVLDDEWKRYFNSVDSPVDKTLFSSVQIHYTATPVFENMDDPLPNRGGFYQGKNEVVHVPDIPEPEVRKKAARSEVAVVIDDENRKKALELLREYYKEGARDRMSGAIAATLYRGGWYSEDAAEFVHDLAILSGDEEADHRYKNAFRICDAIDNSRPAQGIPTLKKEFKIKNLEQLLDFLGLGEPDVEQEVTRLNNKSGPDDVRRIVGLLIRLPKAEQEFFLDKIKKTTGFSKPALSELLKDVKEENGLAQTTSGFQDKLVSFFLDGNYKQGTHFLRSSDKRYWRYNGACWEIAPDDLVKKEMIECAREVINTNQLKVSLSCSVNAALNLLEGDSFREEDPFGIAKQDIPPVMNCRNGEFWSDKEGVFLPHRADSYLRYCLNADYDPRAKSPKFDQAVLDIFAKSSDPEGMRRHFMELAGYICQPWRKHAIIVLLHGGGSNGKSSLMSIINRILGHNMVMAARINEIGKDKFKIGSLDGKLLLYDDDVSMSTRIDDGFLKTISEQKLITGEQKYKDPFQFISRVVPVMSANDYPLISDLTEGLRRRMLVIPFARRFTEEERELGLFDEIWDEEASGILNQIIKGFSRLKKRGRFQESDDCVEARSKWITRSNILPTFISEVCEIGTGYKQNLSEFYAEFDRYCDRTGARPIPRQQWLRSRLEQLGYEISKTGGHLMVRGIRIDSRIPEVKM